MFRWIFLLNLGTTLALIGLIWTIQVVQYPLFNRVGTESFVQYHAGHSQRITWVVAPLMLLELASAIAFVMAKTRPVPDEVIPGWAPGVGLALVVIVWLSTAFLQVPAHGQLAAGFDPQSHTYLVATNWVRTLAWSLRGGLLLWLTSRLF